MSSDRQRLASLCTACLRDGFDVQMRAFGQSMQPTIHDGALIRIQPIVPDQVRVGDVILYCRAGGVIAHRVVTLIHQDGELVELTTRGDASSTCDASIHAHQILGKVIAVEGQKRIAITWWRRFKCWYDLHLRLCCTKCLNFLK